MSSLAKVTGVADRPERNGDHVIQVRLASGALVEAAIAPEQAVALVQLLQPKILERAGKSAQNAELPEVDMVDAGIVHKGPEAQLMVSTSQTGSLVLLMDDRVLAKLRLEIDRLLTYRKAPSSRN